MDANTISRVIGVFLMLLVLVFWGFVLLRLVKNRFAPVRTVSAAVVDTYRRQTLSKMHGTFKREACVVVFSVGSTRLSFVVSDFSFNTYRVGDEGFLQYKGNQLLDFSQEKV